MKTGHPTDPADIGDGCEMLLRLPAEIAYSDLPRGAVSRVARLRALSADDIADLELAVTEAFVLLVDRLESRSTIEVAVRRAAPDSGMEVLVVAVGADTSWPDGVEDTTSWQVLSFLSSRIVATRLQAGPGIAIRYRI